VPADEEVGLGPAIGGELPTAARVDVAGLTRRVAVADHRGKSGGVDGAEGGDDEEDVGRLHLEGLSASR
jgi:hypothetical protein